MNNTLDNNYAGFYRVNNLAEWTEPFVIGALYFDDATHVLYLATSSTRKGLIEYSNAIIDMSFDETQNILKIVLKDGTVKEISLDSLDLHPDYKTRANVISMHLSYPRANAEDRPDVNVNVFASPAGSRSCDIYVNGGEEPFTVTKKHGEYVFDEPVHEFRFVKKTTDYLGESTYGVNDTLQAVYYISANLLTCNSMFRNCRALDYVYLYELDTEKVTSFDYMFAGCTALRALDLSDTDFSNAVSAVGMFMGCTFKTIFLDMDWDATTDGREIDLSYMFAHNPYLQFVDFSEFKVKGITNVEGMFEDCPSLENIEFVKNLDLSTVKNANNLFKNCISLTNDDIDFFTKEILPTMPKDCSCDGMFSGTSGLDSTEQLKDMDLSEKTSLRRFFAGSAIKEAVIDASFDTANVRSMEGMLENCTSLSYVDLDKMNTSNVTDMSELFKDCTYLNYYVRKSRSNSIESNVLGATRRLEYVAPMVDGSEGMLVFGAVNEDGSLTPDLDTRIAYLPSDISKVTDMSEMFSWRSRRADWDKQHKVELIQMDKYPAGTGEKLVNVDGMFFMNNARSIKLYLDLSNVESYNEMFVPRDLKRAEADNMFEELELGPKVLASHNASEIYLVSNNWSGLSVIKTLYDNLYDRSGDSKLTIYVSNKTYNCIMDTAAMMNLTESEMAWVKKNCPDLVSDDKLVTGVMEDRLEKYNYDIKVFKYTDESATGWSF